MTLNFKRVSKDQNKKSIMTKLFDHEELDDLFGFFKISNREKHGPEIKRAENPAWMVRVGSGQFLIDADKLEDNSPIKKDFEKLLAAGTHEYITKQKSNGSTFRTVGPKGANEPLKAAPRLLM